MESYFLREKQVSIMVISLLRSVEDYYAINVHIKKHQLLAYVALFRDMNLEGLHLMNKNTDHKKHGELRFEK